MSDFILERSDLTEQERVIIAMGGIALILAAMDNLELQELSLAQFVPHNYIANLLGMDIEVVRAATQNAEESGYCEHFPQGGK